MKNRFIETCSRIGIIPAKQEFDALELRYSEAARAYHNLGHIKNCLEDFDLAKNLAEEPDAVELAIWYHDIIYDTRAKDNEEQSARIAYRVCRCNNLGRGFSSKVDKLIIATKHNAIPESIDENLIVDIDLAIFGRPEFDEYEKNIRKEYEWVPIDEYNAGREKILQGFLGRGDIYLTDFFVEKYKEKAIANLGRAIAALK